MQLSWIIVVVISLMQATISTVLSLLFGFFLLAWSRFIRLPWAKLLYATSGMVALMPTKSIALGILLAYHITGIVGIILAHAMLNGAFVFFMLYRAYKQIDHHLLWVATQLGASAKNVYYTLPCVLLKPAVTAVTILVFTLCFSSYSIPLFLAHHWYEYTLDITACQLYQNGELLSASGHMIVRALILVPLWWLYEQYATRAMAHVTLSDVQHHAIPHQTPLVRNVIFFLGIMVLIILLYPFLYFVWYALEHNLGALWYLFLFSSEILVDTTSFWRATYHTLVSALLSSIVNVLFGGMISYLYSTHNTRLYMTIALICSSSLLVGSLWCELIFSSGPWCSPLFRASICQFLLHLPFMVRLIVARLQDYQKEWMYLAYCYGASSYQQWRFIILPFIKSTLLHGWGICFGLSLTESTALRVMTQQHWITLPMASKLLYQQGDYAASLAIVLLLVWAIFVVQGIAYALGARSNV